MFLQSLTADSTSRRDKIRSHLSLFGQLLSAFKIKFHEAFLCARYNKCIRFAVIILLIVIILKFHANEAFCKRYK
ncbi:hypothetical protein L596_002188 [Steinernema carpocapsae]|uniref:Uncharacterized protein n=1 Tax=Steinernema carpocapsae TaxID=34508 RepID=A0A4U8UNS2_STECR|nr:hypothetical protein L596_002188 [Steinernema carpocapsae]